MVTITLPEASAHLSGICPPSNQPDEYGLFKVGPGAGPEPTHPQHFQKYLRPRRHSLKAVPQAPGDKPNLSDEG